MANSAARCATKAYTLGLTSRPEVWSAHSSVGGRSSQPQQARRPAATSGPTRGQGRAGTHRRRVLQHRASNVARCGSDSWRNRDNPFGGMLFIEGHLAVVEVLRAVAAELGRQMARVTLARVARRPGVASVLVRASRPEQPEQNIAALDVASTPEQQGRLDGAVEPPRLNPYFMFALPTALIFGDRQVQA